METIIDNSVSRLRHDPQVECVCVVANPTSFSPLIDGFDLLFLIITDNKNKVEHISHYIKDGRRIQERWLDAEELERFILTGKNRNVIQWILQGDILLDRRLYLETLRHKLLEFPKELRGKKLFVEFNWFSNSYMLSKEYLKEGQILDAYNSILKALQHWARIAIIEAGFHPEVMVWAQVRKINPGVYKLYEELTTSKETVEQRVELVVLACEFSMLTKMKSCCSLLLDVLGSRKEPWSPDELRLHPNIRELNIDPALLLKKMISRALVREIPVASPGSSFLELRYIAV